MIPQEFIDHYNLQDKFLNGFIYIRIKHGMHDLPQAGKNWSNPGRISLMSVAINDTTRTQDLPRLDHTLTVVLLSLPSEVIMV